MYQGISSPSDYNPIPGLEQNFGGHKFKDDRKVEITVKNSGWQKHGPERPRLTVRYSNSSVADTVWG